MFVQQNSIFLRHLLYAGTFAHSAHLLVKLTEVKWSILNLFHTRPIMQWYFSLLISSRTQPILLIAFRLSVNMLNVAVPKHESQKTFFLK
jgi:hypothetical protein